MPNKNDQIRMNTKKLREIDDSGNSNAVFRRISNPALVGSGGNNFASAGVRAKCTTDAGAGATITANLYDTITGVEQTTGEGAGITVYCNIHNGTDLNETLPRLESGKDIFVGTSVYDNSGTPETRWYCTGIPFQGSEDCVCS